MLQAVDAFTFESKPAALENWYAECEPETQRPCWRTAESYEAHEYEDGATLVVRMRSHDVRELWRTLPGTLDHICRTVETSRSLLLQLPNDWDEAGSPRIEEATWRRACEFLARYARWIWDNDGKVIDSPSITSGPDGSIDLHWDHTDYEMLINIPSDANAMAGFYGDDRGRVSIKGRFDPSRVNEGLLHWLIKAR